MVTLLLNLAGSGQIMLPVWAHCHLMVPGAQFRLDFSQGGMGISANQVPMRLSKRHFAMLPGEVAESVRDAFGFVRGLAIYSFMVKVAPCSTPGLFTWTVLPCDATK